MSRRTITVTIDGLEFTVAPTWDPGDDQVGIRAGWDCSDIEKVEMRDMEECIEGMRSKVEKAAHTQMRGETLEDWNYDG
jgi:hypothetical protein